ncbi:hypothetical protein OPIT5_01740 [Opitutaceae bacterium TAV5]|nr:hypothetical protein OPIT5_01740 [Opitutaceae bacterium TAV5]
MFIDRNCARRRNPDRRQKNIGPMGSVERRLRGPPQWRAVRVYRLCPEGRRAGGIATTDVTGEVWFKGLVSVMKDRIQDAW